MNVKRVCKTLKEKQNNKGKSNTKLIVYCQIREPKQTKNRSSVPTLVTLTLGAACVHASEVSGAALVFQFIWN